MLIDSFGRQTYPGCCKNECFNELFEEACVQIILYMYGNWSFSDILVQLYSF